MAPATAAGPGTLNDSTAGWANLRSVYYCTLPSSLVMAPGAYSVLCVVADSPIWAVIPMPFGYIANSISRLSAKPLCTLHTDPFLDLIVESTLVSPL